MVQGWLLLMDAGMSPSLGRAASQYKSGGSSAAELKSLVRFSSRIFFLLAIGFLIVSIPAAPWIASNWLSVKNLSIGSVEFSIVVMLFAVAIRWRSQPYRSIITGLEEQVWLNAFNAVLVTFRTFGSVAVALICGPNLFIFFSYQLAIAAIEAIGMYRKVAKLLPRKKSDSVSRVNPSDVRFFLKMSATLMVTTATWTLLTQLDRLVLSKVISLSDFGVFSMAVLCASGIMALSGPLTGVLGPRLTIMLERKDFEGFLKVYRASMRFSISIVFNGALTIALFSDHLMMIWCADSNVAIKASPIFFWYVIGNGFQALTAIFYNLQYAFGNLRLHLIGGCLLASTVVPSVIVAALKYGAVGTGVIWCAQAALYFFIWGWIVHSRFLKTYRWDWLFRDALPLSLPTLAIGCLLKELPIPWGHGQVNDLIYLALCVITCMVTSLVCNRDISSRALTWVGCKNT